MIRLPIQLRQALARLTLPVLFVAAFAIMLVGKADTVLVDRARIALADGLGPLYALLAPPLSGIRGVAGDIAGLWSAERDNARLRDEVARLRQWQSVALALEEENRRLKAQLNWIPDPPASFVTARVVADGGGLYARAAIVSLGPGHHVRKGEVAMDASGLAGRVTEVGERTARVLLITDLSSRIPVQLEQSHSRAILAGANTGQPRLLYWSDGPPAEGERVVTSGEANALPPNLPVGTVHWTASHVPEVIPAADLTRLDVLRLIDYRLDGPAG
jgi:rod shape-determining protein MreC